MKGLWYLAAIGTLALASFAWQSDTAIASNEIAKQESVVCTTCHDKPGSKLLTDRGKYWEIMRTFDGYDDIETVFESCTTCHVRKPGSLKLTQTGKRFHRLVGDMEGLKAFLEGEHPQPPEEANEGTAGGSGDP